MLPSIDLAGIETGILTAVIIAALGLVWRGLRDSRKTLYDIHTELTDQRINCLATLQKQGQKQIDVLENIDRTLGTQNSYWKGYFDGPRRS
jgi:hypothetical protein